MEKKKIKSTTAYKTNYFNPDGLNMVSDIEEQIHHYTVFNELGKIVFEQSFDDNGELEQEAYYTYDDKGFLVKEEIKDGDGEILEKKTYENDDSGKILVKKQYYVDDSFDTTTYKYDAGNLIEKRTVNTDGEQEGLEIFQYQNGNLVLEMVYDEQEQLIRKNTLIYDDKNQVIEINSWSIDDEKQYKTVFEYDEKGRKTEQLVYINDKLHGRQQFIFDESLDQLIELIDEDPYKKDITYFKYDDRGNRIEQLEYNKKEELNHKIERQYNEFNHMIFSEVLIDRHGYGPNQHYSVRFVHEYFE